MRKIKFAAVTMSLAAVVAFIFSACGDEIPQGDETSFPADTTIYLRISGGIDGTNSAAVADIDRDGDGIWTVKMIEPIYGFTVRGGEVSFDGDTARTVVATPFDAVCAAIDDGKVTGKVLGGKNYAFSYAEGDDTPSAVTVDGLKYTLVKAMPSDKVMLS